MWPAAPLQCWFLLLAAAVVLVTPVINDKGFTSSEMQLLYDEHHSKGKWVSLLPLPLLPLSPSSPAKAAELLF